MNTKGCMIYGAGLSGAAALLFLEGNYGYKCISFIDDSPAKIGSCFFSIRVIALSDAVKICKEKGLEIFIASTQYWFDLEQNLKKHGFKNYKMFHCLSYVDDDVVPNYGFINKELAEKTEDLLSDEYSKITYKNILEHRRLNRKYYVNHHDQYFIYYTPKSDDIVFDCGAAYGWFTQRALSYIKTGKIYAFEPDSMLFRIFVSKYGDSKIVIPVNLGVFNKAGYVKFSTTFAHGSNRIDENGDAVIDVIDIDSFVAKNKIEKVDFIKMDIEGAELDAITGAHNTIKKFKPAMALCLYHKTDDLWNIPLKVKEIRDDYKLFIEHHSVGLGETVLYAV